MIDSGEILGKANLRERGAKTEYAFSQQSDSVGNGYFFEAGASCERGIADGGHCVGNCDAGQAGAISKCLRANGGHVFGNCDAFKLCTTVKGALSDGDDRIRHRDGDDGRATAEGEIVDFFASRDSNAFELRRNAGGVLCVFIRAKEISEEGIACFGFCCANEGDCDAFQADASIECHGVNEGHGIGNGQLRQTAAEAECFLADGGYGIREGDALQTGTAEEGAVADGLHLAAHDNACEVCTIIKRFVADGGYPIAQRRGRRNQKILVCADAEAVYIAGAVTVGYEGESLARIL